MGHKVTLIPGDGIGPEVVAAAKRVIDASGASIDWDLQQAGAVVIPDHGTPLPDSVLDSIRTNGVALKGPIATPIGSGFRSVNVALRQALTLYANLRPVRSYRGIPSPFEDVDLIIVRENTEDLYTGIEHYVGDVGAVGIKITTRGGSERIAQFAFDTARRYGRRAVTAVHKANVLTASDGLFLQSVRAIAGKYPDIAFDDRTADNLAAQIIRRPRDFDVLVLPNLLGDIFSDLCAGLVGGLGVAPGANIGEHGAVFEAVHGSAPDIAGRNLANPTAMILSGAMMLDHLGEFEASARLRAATESVLAEGWAVTRDLGGNAGTTDMATAIVKRLDASRDVNVNLLDLGNRVMDVRRVAAQSSVDGRVGAVTASNQVATIFRHLQGTGTTAHVNPEFDVLLVVLDGEGSVDIAGERYPLHAGHVAAIPKGTRRQIRATEGTLVYLAINQTA